MCQMSEIFLTTKSLCKVIIRHVHEQIKCEKCNKDLKSSLERHLNKVQYLVRLSNFDLNKSYTGTGLYNTKCEVITIFVGDAESVSHWMVHAIMF